MIRPERKWLWRSLAATLIACAVGAAIWYDHYSTQPMLSVIHIPDAYARRSGHFSANVWGTLSEAATSAEYRLNDGEWRPIPQGRPRARPPFFVIELEAPRLVPGVNVLELRAHAPLRPESSLRKTFRYADDPVSLPRVVEWDSADLDVQDGVWETVRVDGQWRVRPVPGFEAYDRILAVTGAFAGGRRIESDVTFRNSAIVAGVGANEFGFGIFSLWGGHPDDGSRFPRRGWSFSMAWYWSKPEGVGNEVSHRIGSETPLWVNAYRRLDIEPDTTYRIIVETFPEVTRSGEHVRYRQRMKWWPESTAEPSAWLETTDDTGARLPQGDYAVALMAFKSQVEFGSVRITALPDRIVEPAPAGRSHVNR